MEEMRRVAMAYYVKMSNYQQQMVRGFYRSIDTNGDGKVSIHEYLDFLTQNGYNQHVPPNLFKLLDKNNDGTLDFEECVTLFYMVTCHRLVICDGCRSYLWGLHFLCVECHSAGGRTFDLCCSCYRNNNFSHAHSTFLDNYALLRTKPRKPKQEVSPREEEDDDDDDDDYDDDDDDDYDDDDDDEEDDFVPVIHKRVVIHHYVNSPPENWPQAPSASSAAPKNVAKTYAKNSRDSGLKPNKSKKEVEIKEVVDAIKTGLEIGTNVADIADMAANGDCTIM